jgi:hypothetical protein
VRPDAGALENGAPDELGGAGIAIVACVLRALGEHEEVLAVRAVREEARGHDAPCADTLEAVEALLELLGRVVRAPDDDEVLLPPAHVQLAVGDEAEVAGVQPALRQGARGGFGLPEVASHQGRSAGEDPPHLPLRQGPAVGAAHLDLASRDRRPDGDDASRPVHDFPGHREARRVHAERRRGSGRWRERHGEGGLGEAVHGPQRSRVEGERREALRESAESPDRDGLRPADREAPAGQVHALEIPVPHPLRADRVAKRRRHRDRGAVARDRPQPQRRAGQEVLRRDEDQGAGVVHREEQAADETHVVVERQPGHTALREEVRGRQQRLEGRELGHQVPVREGDGLRVGRRAG